MPTKTTTLNLFDIQGNSLGGFSKDFQANLFLKFKSASAGRAWITEISDAVSNACSANVLEFNNEFKRLKKQGQAKPEALIQALWVNLALSFEGLTALDIKKDVLKFPSEFKNGMASRAADIGDTGKSAPANWIPPFNKPTEVHALLIVAADHPGQLQKQVDAITTTAAFKAGCSILLNQPGRTRPDLPGHEHFGFKDGISQPGVRGVDLPDDPVGNPNQGHPGQDLLWPGEFVLGYATQIPHLANGDNTSPNPHPGDDSESGPSRTEHGSYLVFRRLRQDVPGFLANVKTLAASLGWTEDLTGAKMVGRYRSGCPIEQTEFHPLPYTPPSIDPGDPHTGNPILATSNTLNNNFEYEDDPVGVVCPMSAHVRKAYPRDEPTPKNKPEDSESETQTHRVLRRGIPYGAPYDPHDPASASVDRGLLFLAYQNSIKNHFEFIQSQWVNDPTFPPTPKGATPRPAGLPGIDPIMSQMPKGDMLIDPTKPPVSINHFVTTTGGEYFFSPSISALADIGSGKIK